MKILHHGLCSQVGEVNDILSGENLQWKRRTTEKSSYVCMDRSRQVCAVLLSQAFVIELWDMSSLPCLMSRLTLCSLKPESDQQQQFLPSWARDCQCQCMAWSDCKQYLCGVFGKSNKLISSSSNTSSVTSVFMLWEVETGLLVTTRQYVPASHISIPLLTLRIDCDTYLTLASSFVSCRQVALFCCISCSVASSGFCCFLSVVRFTGRSSCSCCIVDRATWTAYIA